MAYYGGDAIQVLGRRSVKQKIKQWGGVQLSLSDRPYNIQKHTINRQYMKIDKLTTDEIQKIVNAESGLLKDTAHVFNRIGFHSYQDWTKAHIKAHLYPDAMPTIMVRSKKDVRSIRVRSLHSMSI